MAERENLRNFDLPELEGLMLRIKQPLYRARQLAGWLFQKGAVSFDEMTDLPSPLRINLEEGFYLDGINVLSRQESRDGTIKYLFALKDGQKIESVYMLHGYGRTACVSSQAGCRMGCRLCASGLLGWQRNLRSGEIYEQVLSMERDRGLPVTHVVLMGIGEPLDNYDEVIRFINVTCAPYGHNLSSRRVTVSTCGLLPGIYRLKEEGLPVNLAVSLHAPNDKLRDFLVPVNRRYPLAELISACRAYTKDTSRRITFEYAMIKDVNDSRDHAFELAELVRGLLCHINLIPLNEVLERGFFASPPERINCFKNVLAQRNINVTVRRKLGADIHGACGQLRLSIGR